MKLNYKTFLNKTKEYVEQTEMQISIIQRELGKLEDWLNTLKFFIEKVEEA